MTKPEIELNQSEVSRIFAAARNDAELDSLRVQNAQLIELLRQMKNGLVPL